MKILISKKIFIGIVILAFLYFLTKIEFNNLKLSGYVYPLIWISIPLILRYILVKENMSKAIFLFCVVLYLFISIFYSLFGVFCSWSNDSVLYISKKDKSLQIVCRRYDCYGTAEDCRLYQVKKLTDNIKWVTKLEEKVFDSTEWQDVPFNSELYNP